jgi:hypothetical protein
MSTLPYDIIIEIIAKLDYVEDYIHAVMMCKKFYVDRFKIAKLIHKMNGKDDIATEVRTYLDILGLSIEYKFNLTNGWKHGPFIVTLDSYCSTLRMYKGTYTFGKLDGRLSLYRIDGARSLFIDYNMGAGIRLSVDRQYASNPTNLLDIKLIYRLLLTTLAGEVTLITKSVINHHERIRQIAAEYGHEIICGFHDVDGASIEYTEVKVDGVRIAYIATTPAGRLFSSFIVARSPLPFVAAVKHLF